MVITLSFLLPMLNQKNHDESPAVIQFLDYQEDNMYVKKQAK